MFGLGKTVSKTGLGILYFSHGKFNLINVDKKISEFLLFRVNGKKSVAMISTKYSAYSYKGITYYGVYEGDQNTFDPPTGLILDELTKIDFENYLNESEERRFHTKRIKPEDIRPHHIIEDVLRSLLDGTILHHLMIQIKKQDKETLVYVFAAGMGTAIMLLVILGALSPKTIHLQIGGLILQSINVFITKFL